MKKRNIVIFSLLLIFALCLLSYKIQKIKTTDEAESYQKYSTYVDSKNGLSFEYPSDRVISQQGENVFIINKQNEDFFYVILNVKSNTQFVEEYVASVNSNCDKQKKSEEEVDGGSECFKYTFIKEKELKNGYMANKYLRSAAGGAGPAITYFIHQNDTLYSFTLTQALEDFQENTKGDFDEISSVVSEVYKHLLDTIAFSH